MRKILFLAAAIYFLIAPYTYHPDTKLVLEYATVGSGKIWDIYGYLNIHPGDIPKFHYPPLNFWVVKMEMVLVELVGGRSVDKWLSQGGNVAFSDSRVFLYNLATKIPLLLLTLLCGWVIYQIARNSGWKEGEAVRAASWWLFNPLTIYSVVVMGQNDVLAICPFLVGWWLMKKYPLVAFGLFGIAAGIKSYPLIWAVYMLAADKKYSWLKRIIYGAVTILVYLLPMLPFLGRGYFREEVIYSGLAVRMFESYIGIGFGEKVLVVPILLGWWWLVMESAKRMSLTKVAGMLGGVCLIILGFSHFHPQWLVWLMPFASFYVVRRPKIGLGLALLLMAVVGVIVLFEDKFLYWGLLTPLNPGLINWPYLTEFMTARGVETGLLNNLAHTLVAVVAAYWLKVVYDEK